MKSAGSTDPQGLPIGSASGGGAYGTQGYTAQFGQPDNFDPSAHPHNNPRRRMQQEEESGAGDADDNDWTVTYTDMVTLLMAFFVMLITLTIIEKKETADSTEQPGEASPYRPTPANSATLSVSPFDGHGITLLEGGHPLNLDPNEDQNFDVATRPPTTRYPTITITPRPTPMPTPPPAGQQPDPNAAPNANTALARRLQAMVQQNNLGGQVQVVSNEASVTVRISDRILFQSGKAALEGAGKDLIARLLPMLNQPGQILSIEGHTDNIPISTAMYPSNWELSASRAATVVRQLIDLGLPPNRLRAIAYADTKPVGPNSTADSRATNRRVEMVITSDTAPTQP